MKTFKKLLIYSIFILFLTSSSCTKPIPTGDNTFSCYINGDLFLPKGSNSITTPGPIDDGLVLTNQELFFSAIADDSKSIDVVFNVVNWGVGTFYLTSSDGDFYNHQITHAFVRINGVKYLSKDNSGKVTFIEADIDGNTKGTFEFTLYNENDENDIIHVTDGQFDD